jgi:hypothetical protein
VTTPKEDKMTQNEAKEARRPIAEVLPGAELHPLVQGDEFLEAFAMIKTRDSDGDTG